MTRPFIISMLLALTVGMAGMGSRDLIDRNRSWLQVTRFLSANPIQHRYDLDQIISADVIEDGTPRKLVSAARIAALVEPCSRSIPILTSALEYQPDDVLLNFFIGNALYQCGDRKVAGSYWKKTNASSLFSNWCLVYWQERDVYRVLDRCKLALNIDPNNAQAHDLIGRAYTLQGDFGQALIHYRRVIDLDDSISTIYERAAIVSINLKHLEQAEMYLQRARGLYPDEAAVYYWLGKIRWFQKDYPAAEEYLLTAIYYDDSKAYHFSLLADTYCALKRPADARSYYLLAEERTSDDATVRNKREIVSTRCQ